MDESPIRSPHDEPLVPDATRPNAGGSYVRLPDGSLMPEADWLAAQAEGGQVQAAPQATQPSRRRGPEKEA